MTLLSSYNLCMWSLVPFVDGQWIAFVCCSCGWLEQSRNLCYVGSAHLEQEHCSYLRVAIIYVVVAASLGGRLSCMFGLVVCNCVMRSWCLTGGWRECYPFPKDWIDGLRKDEAIRRFCLVQMTALSYTNSQCFDTAGCKVTRTTSGLQ